MEEAMVDNTLDLNLLPAEYTFQAGVQRDEDTNRGEQAQLLSSTSQGCLVTGQWPLIRAQRVEILHQCVTSGIYRVDSAELAQCIWDNSTHFLEIGFARVETC